ncbi:hypothetical protein HY633_01185, partial [Candidatus Uhrbacteria bacterium]|nr:hypothetical protein [Candidatus Uhrbacteria bacterium]
DNIIGWATAGTERMRLSSANVSIGSTSTTSMFNVGTANAFQVTSAGTVTTTSTVQGTDFFASASGAGSGYTFSSTGNDDGMFFVSNDIIGWATAGTERMRLSGSNFGIGSASPSQLLSVGASNQFTVNTGGNMITTGTTQAARAYVDGGSVGSPGYSFTGTGGTDDGIYFVSNDIFAFSTAGTERMRLSSANVSIGSTTTTSMFNVGTSAQFQVGSTGNMTLSANSGIATYASAADNTFIWRIPQNGATNGACESGGSEGIRLQNLAGTQVGHMCIANGTSQLSWFAQSYNATSTDLAENYSTDPADQIEPGDIVMLDASAGANKVMKTEAAYATMLGVISTSPGLLLSGIDEATGASDTVHPQPVAISGRVPIKVSIENGPIAIGDPITSSSTPGVGMKASTSGRIVGYALEPYTGDESGKIKVFMNLGWHEVAPSIAGDISPTVDDHSDLDLHGRSILQVKSIASLGGDWSIDENGLMTVKEIHAEKVRAKSLEVEADAATQTIGQGVIHVGNSSVVIENAAIRQNTRIFVTFYGPVEGSWWISRRENGRFEISLTKVATTDLQFEYWLLGLVDNRPTPEPAPEPTPEPAPELPAASSEASESVPVEILPPGEELTTEPPTEQPTPETQTEQPPSQEESGP